MYGERIRILRKLAGETQEQLANIMEVSQRTVANWEREEREPNLKKLTALAEHYHCSVDYLTGMMDNPLYVYSEEDSTKISTKKEAPAELPKPVEETVIPLTGMPKTPQELAQFVSGVLATLGLGKHTSG